MDKKIGGGPNFDWIQHEVDGFGERLLLALDAPEGERLLVDIQAVSFAADDILYVETQDGAFLKITPDKNPVVYHSDDHRLSDEIGIDEEFVKQLGLDIVTEQS